MVKSKVGLEVGGSPMVMEENGGVRVVVKTQIVAGRRVEA